MIKNIIYDKKNDKNIKHDKKNDEKIIYMIKT